MSFVTAILVGGFGNRVFIIHTALYYAQMTNRKFVLVKEFIKPNLHESEQITTESLEKLFFPFDIYRGSDYRNWHRITDPEQNAFKYQQIPSYKGKSIVFEGYFQHPKYIPVSVKSPNLIKKHHTYFLHIRLGDYCNTNYDIPLKNYYSNAIITIKNDDPDAKFLIFCNENNKVNEYILNTITVQFDYQISKAETAYDTLNEMSSCAGAICANSSLSWLGAYYQSEPKKNIYMPHPWMKNKMNIDLYPKWAKIIDIYKSINVE
jgi:hypothetical protein